MIIVLPGVWGVRTLRRDGARRACVRRTQARVRKLAVVMGSGYSRASVPRKGRIAATSPSIPPLNGEGGGVGNVRSFTERGGRNCRGARLCAPTRLGGAGLRWRRWAARGVGEIPRSARNDKGRMEWQVAHGCAALRVWEVRAYGGDDGQRVAWGRFLAPLGMTGGRNGRGILSERAADGPLGYARGGRAPLRVWDVWADGGHVDPFAVWGGSIPPAPRRPRTRPSR